MQFTKSICKIILLIVLTNYVVSRETIGDRPVSLTNLVQHRLLDIVSFFNGMSWLVD